METVIEVVKLYKCFYFFPSLLVGWCILIVYIAIIVINSKILLLHCLYISRPYIDTEADKIDSSPYAIVEKSNCNTQRFLGLFPFLL